MKKPSFLDKLKEEGKLELVEPSDMLSESFKKKSRDCLTSAKLLFKESLFENSIGEAYYSMYNIIQSLYFKCGIKCENHSAAAVLLRDLFKEKEIFSIFSDAKEERIDKQYYTLSMQAVPVTKKSASDLIHSAEQFILSADTIIREIKLEKIRGIREEFDRI